MKSLVSGVWSRRIAAVLAFTILGLLAGFGYHQIKAETYTATTTLFLRAPDFRDSSSAYQGDLFSQQRARSYAGLVESEELAQMVISYLNIAMTPAEMAAKVVAKSEDRTVLLDVSASDANPATAAKIANGYGAVFPRYMAEIENLGMDPAIAANPLAKVVRNATPPEKPDGFGLTVVCTIGALLGACVGVVVAWSYARLRGGRHAIRNGSATARRQRHSDTNPRMRDRNFGSLSRDGQFLQWSDL